MLPRKVHAQGTYAHFVTFSCFKRRRSLDHEICKRVVLGTLASELAKQSGTCVGFVVMPDHVHALIWFSEEYNISAFMDKWKELSSKQIAEALRVHLPAYWKEIGATDPIWQAGYYGFNIYSDEKLREKLTYMHENPVRAGLVVKACAWPWSSAGFWLKEKSVGVRLSWPG